MKKNIKTAVLFNIMILFASIAVHGVAFSGYAGIKSDFVSDEESDVFTPEMKLQAYFAGQINFSPNFLMRTEISVRTDDVLSQNLFKETESVFCIDEISGTFTLPVSGLTQYFNLFMGIYEPIGSDVFLQRHFGISPITSMITESWLGLKGSTVYPFYGIGGSYIIRFNELPLATGLYIYKNNENEKEENQLNLDLRFAYSSPIFTVDFAAGVGAPLQTSSGAQNVILLIDRLYLHMGIDALLGNRFSFASLFLQAGVNNIPLLAGEEFEISTDDIYLVFEPRIHFSKFDIRLTMFSLPEDTVEKLIFVNNTFGVNATVFTDKLYAHNKDVTVGSHATLSFPGKDFFALKEPLTLFTDEDGFEIKVSPFLSFPVLSGTVKTMLQIDVTEIMKMTLNKAFSFNIGYKTHL